jgi:urea transporter
MSQIRLVSTEARVPVSTVRCNVEPFVYRTCIVVLFASAVLLMWGKAPKALPNELSTSNSSKWVPSCGPAIGELMAISDGSEFL